jgi:hypothetical protein
VIVIFQSARGGIAWIACWVGDICQKRKKKPFATADIENPARPANHSGIAAK